MRRMFFGLAMLGIAAVAPGWAVAGDQEIAQEVIQKLEEQKQAGQLKGFRLGVSVKEGHVWLKGRTTSPEQRDMVLSLARRVAGVKAVVNEVEIDKAADAPVPAAATNPGLSGAWQSNVGTAPPPAISARKLVPATRSGPSSQNVEIHKLPATSGLSGNLPSAPESAPALAQPASVARADFFGSGSAQRIPAEAPQQGTRFTSAAQDSPTPAKPAAGTAANRRTSAVTSQPAPQRSTLAAAPVTASAQPQSAHMGAPHPNQMPVPYYGGRQVNYSQPGQPIPAYVPMAGGGQVAPARYDHPRMPGYAWPSYAAYPNYAAVTYPRQYSPTAWPYIGPFYPYPQVPLGWRKVSLEWDDGWWQLDFWEK